MRFHFGLSFSWKTIKKFLIPILLGLLAFFGFNFIYDNKSIPLGFIQVKAEEVNDITSDDIPDEIEDNFNYWSYVLNDSNDEVVHKPIHNKIYWFDDNTTEIGVLSSIYILLFFYCLIMIIFKILTFIKNIRW